MRIADLIKTNWYGVKHYGSVDFLICDFQDSMKPIVAIELNWKEHYLNFWRRNSDYRKRKILNKHWIFLYCIKNEELEHIADKINDINNRYLH